MKSYEKLNLNVEGTAEYYVKRGNQPSYDPLRYGLISYVYDPLRYSTGNIC